MAHEGAVAVLLNANAKQVSDRIQGAISHVVPPQDIFLSHSKGEARAIARAVVDRRYDTVFIGGGLGYEVNNWLRFDVTAEYRSKAEMTAFGTYTFGGGTFGDGYHANLQSWVFLANAYVDLGTWDCITPFIGVGVGGAYNKIADLTDVGIGTSGSGIGRDSAAWSPAYAAYAGLAYNVSQSLKLELTYRYLNYGSTTDTIDCTGGCNPDSYKFGHFSSNDIMLGMRWMLSPAPAVVAPLSTRG